MVYAHITYGGVLVLCIRACGFDIRFANAVVYIMCVEVLGCVHGYMEIMYVGWEVICMVFTCRFLCVAMQDMC